MSADEYLPYVLELAADVLVLRKDVFVDRFRSLTAVMALIVIFKCSSTLWALPHFFHLASEPYKFSLALSSIFINQPARSFFLSAGFLQFL